MKESLLLGLFLSILSPGRGSAEDAFLGIEFGGRPLALGGAYVAVADDAGAVLWNPAGAAQAKGFSVAGSQNHLTFTDNAYSVSSVASLRGWGAFSLSVQHLVVENTLLTRPVLDANGNPVLDPATNQPLVEIGGFGEENDATFLAGYALALTPRVLVGGAAKWLVSKAGSTPGRGWGADAGILLLLPGGWRAGVAADDLGRTTVAWKDGTRTAFSTVVRGGAAWEPGADWLLAVGLATPAAELDLATSAGVEWRFSESVAFRAGLSDWRITGGVGFRMPLANAGSFAFADYAFITGSRFEDRSRLTLGVTF